MIIPIYQVDAFTDKVFGGNPAAVCPLREWLSDHLMQRIGMENNLSETAFIVKTDNDYQIRWFTPAVEVDLCGHATLASAYVVFQHLAYPGDEVIFHSRSGVLKVKKAANGKLTLNFPASKPSLVNDPPAFMLEALNLPTARVYKGPFDYMVVADNQQQVEALEPDFRKLAQANSRGVVVTARGVEADFISRCFYPQSGIDEDPVTGSAHTMMMPYWAEVLGKTTLSALQLSKRRGRVECELAGDRVLMSGSAVMYMKGNIEI